MGKCSGSGSGKAEGIGRQLGEDACWKCELLLKKRTLAGSGTAFARVGFKVKANSCSDQVG